MTHLRRHDADRYWGLWSDTVWQVSSAVGQRNGHAHTSSVPHGRETIRQVSPAQLWQRSVEVDGDEQCVHERVANLHLRQANRLRAVAFH
eukprot:6247299-Alexandrium_andersonii.AAC.1